MKRFKKILVYQSVDQAASSSLRIASRLSRNMESQVTVVDVRQPEPSPWWDSILPDEWHQQKDSFQQEEALNQLIDQVDFEGDVRVKILEGRPIDVLVHESMEESHDLILKDIESRAGNLYFGSLDLRLLRLAPSAVWLADSGVPPKTRRVLAAVDPHVDRDEMHVNLQIIRVASTVARQDSAELNLVSAWYSASDFVLPGTKATEKIGGTKGRVRQRAWENVEQMIQASSVAIPPERVFFKEGLASDVVADAVLQVQPDLLVMGSVARRGIPGLFIGNTADEVSRQVECSICAIKPDDFPFLLPSSP